MHLNKNKASYVDPYAQIKTRVMLKKASLIPNPGVH